MENKEQKVADKLNEFMNNKNKKVQERLEDIFKDEVKFNPEKQETSDFYERFDDDLGYITKSDDIAALKAMRFSDIVNNSLLGEYDEFGAYRIPEPILAELVALPKKIDAQTPNGLESRAFVDNRVFYFNLTPTKSVADGKARCVLQLREQVSRVGGYYVDTITTNVATYEFDDDKFFYDRAKEVFHLKNYAVDADAPTVATPDEIDARFKFIAAMLNSSTNLLENVEEAYFDKRLQLLNSAPELAFFLTEFNARKKKLEKFFLNSKQKFLYYNQLLSMLMEEYADKLSKTAIWNQLQNAMLKYFELCGEVETRMRADPAAQAAKANVMTEIMEEGKKGGKKAKVPNGVELVGRDSVKKGARTKEAEAKKEAGKDKGKDKGGAEPIAHGLKATPTSKTDEEKKQKQNGGYQQEQDNKKNTAGTDLKKVGNTDYQATDQAVKDYTAGGGGGGSNFLP